MLKEENQAKYENQLPKLEKWSFDRIFGYGTGLASIAGLVGAPFVVQNQDFLSYLYMGFLSILVLLLLMYVILLEKRKLHRYAQAVLYSHFAQHIVRDYLSGLKVSNNFNLEKTTEKLLDAISNCFSIISGKNCRASIVELNEKFELNVIARDSMSSIKPSLRRNKIHLLEDNTDFRNLWYSINDCPRYYLNNNIIKSWINHDYHNSCFSEYGNPEVKCIFGFRFVKKWPLKYKSALVLPIRYISKFSPPIGTGELPPHWNYYGFLCIDSISKNSFDERYSPELGGLFADMLYTYFSQSNFILDTMTTPN